MEDCIGTTNFKKDIDFIIGTWGKFNTILISELLVNGLKLNHARKKAARNKIKGYVSMIIDAAGGAGTVYHPHVRKQVHGEPERAELLKTKSTFVKIHGYGNM